MHGAPYWQATPYTIPIGIGAALFVALGAYLFRRRTERRLVPGATLGALLLFASGLWMGTYALELSLTDFSTKVLLNQLGYFGIAPLPLLWFAYVMRHAGVKLESRVAWAALGSVPVAVVALVLTNSWHGLIWTDLWLDADHGYVVLVNEHGVAFAGFIVYAYALILFGCATLGRTLLRSDGIYRKQTLALLGGGLVPTVGGVVYVAGLSPVPGLNIPVLAFSVASGAVAWSVFRHRLFTLVPVAWESAVESMHDAALVLDGDGRVIDVNPAGEQFLSLPLSDAYGRSVVRVLPAEIVDALDGVPQSDAETETTVPTDDGERALLVETTPLGDEANMTGTLVLLRDVTERVERERRLERQNERLDEFASVVSHDLRNPLTVARGYLELAAETGDEEYFERIEDAHDRMENIIEDLLTLAREGETLTDVTPVALRTVAQEAWDGTVVGDAALDVRADRTIAADRGRLRQLFENLFRNAVEHGSTGRRDAPGDAVEHGSTGNQTTSGDAVEHGSTGSRIPSDDAVEHGSTGNRTVSGDAVEHGSEDDDALTVAVGALDGGFYVEDDGPGIPESERADVFERGYTTHENGTGFGLPIVKTIADAHGWSVSLGESDAGGARFEFTGVETDPEPANAEQSTSD
ncbi:two-component system sensor histidine kinase [Haloferax sp. Atlit-6N]|uniref:histidine kinase N-terminal 7TM domain-containing protein n=1 Tax=Haloferax sp. Atlit-6N TaxID=2077205 RepID=UPI000E270B6F|nr:histidine kinase N-terminal 7TM domain-containing protein [Haloferax sp. Atlit-6N]REA03684.1 two-component system sensor histidine kinase [Haloferax sp. Atlit-6N]